MGSPPLSRPPRTPVRRLICPLLTCAPRTPGVGSRNRRWGILQVSHLIVQLGKPRERSGTSWSLNREAGPCRRHWAATPGPGSLRGHSSASKYQEIDPQARSADPRQRRRADGAESAYLPRCWGSGTGTRRQWILTDLTPSPEGTPRGTQAQWKAQAVRCLEDSTGGNPRGRGRGDGVSDTTPETRPRKPRAERAAG